jgi:cytochrome c
MISHKVDSHEGGGSAMHGWGRCKAVAIAMAMAVSAPAAAAEKDLTDKGEVLVRKDCSRCHAVGLEGESPNPEAPPFRTLSNNYPIEDLAESLAEGIVSGHPEMPIFIFGPRDVDAIIAYLESIQEAAPPESQEMQEIAPDE